jgi:hypothetical protein
LRREKTKQIGQAVNRTRICWATINNTNHYTTCPHDNFAFSCPYQITSYDIISYHIIYCAAKSCLQIQSCRIFVQIGSNPHNLKSLFLSVNRLLSSRKQSLICQSLRGYSVIATLSKRTGMRLQQILLNMILAPEVSGIAFWAERNEHFNPNNSATFDDDGQMRYSISVVTSWNRYFVEGLFGNRITVPKD